MGQALMGQAFIGRAIAKAIAVAGLSAFLSASANAGLRLGPGAVLGLVAVPLHMMTHGMDMPGLHRRAAHAHGAATRAVPSPPPSGRPVPNPPTEPPVVEARADPSHVVEPSRPASAAASPASSPSAPPLGWRIGNGAGGGCRGGNGAGCGAVSMSRATMELGQAHAVGHHVQRYCGQAQNGARPQSQPGVRGC